MQIDIDRSGTPAGLEEVVQSLLILACDGNNLTPGNPDAIDLVITDMTMPQMTGDQLVKEILQIRNDQPIIFCTGFSEKVNGEDAQAMGVRRYIEKPVQLNILATAVREVLDGG